jgi:IS4 transposase
MVTYLDNKTGKDYTFITNNFKPAASTIAEIYHQRWQIELFFKWIKQNLKLKTFIGTSRNAVLWQVWVARNHVSIPQKYKETSRFG